MVVISAAVLSRAGKTLVARQFVDINRARLEGLLAAFPKLLSSSDGKKEHTFVETPTVRYVYQPMEELYMLIITNKSSNILEDLDALTLLAKIVADYCSRPTEEDVTEGAFDLVFAFDEVFALGNKEKLSLRQIQENLEMDSHNERIAEIMQANREREAAEQAAAVAARLATERRQRSHASHGGGSGGAGGYAGGSGAKSYGAGPEVRAFAPQPKQQAEPSFSMGGGMKLGVATKSTADDAFLQQLAREDKSVIAAPIFGGGGAADSSQQAAGGGDSRAPIKGVHFAVTEQVSATLEREGDVQSIEVKGELNLLISDPNSQRIRIGLSPLSKLYSFKTHPAVDKGAFKKNVLQPKNAESKPFPLNRPEPILKWKNKGEVEAPLTISCWPSKGNEDTTVVNLEYAAGDGFLITDVRVAVPIASQVNPVVQEAVGDYEFDSRARELIWTIPRIDESNSDGSLEFVVSHLAGIESLFPISLSFTLSSPLSGVQILGAQQLQDQSPVDTSTEFVVTAEFAVQNI